MLYTSKYQAHPDHVGSLLPADSWYWLIWPRDDAPCSHLACKQKDNREIAIWRCLSMSISGRVERLELDRRRGQMQARALLVTDETSGTQQ